ncbi:MAG: hypothetical protein NXI30_25630 [bacterium]|nr:hypothetical protein [bacterium]
MSLPLRAVRLVALLAIAASLAGCLDRRPALPIVPEGQPLAFADERVARVLARHASRASERAGLTGSARVALSGPDFKLNRPQRIALARPARLRFEILGLFDQLAAILVTDGLDYGFFDASTGEVSRGRVSSALLWNLTKIDLAPDELVGLLLAGPRPADGTLHAGAWLEPSGRLAIAFAWPTDGAEAACLAEDPLDVSASPECALPERAVVATGGQLFFFDEMEELVEVRGLDPGGVIRYRVRFEDYVAIEGPDESRFPKRVTLESPATASEARFQWKRVRFVPELTDEVFQLPETMRGRDG